MQVTMQVTIQVFKETNTIQPINTIILNANLIS